MNLVNKNNVFIDSSTFLGMHSTNEKLKTECVNFFVSHYRTNVFMSLEQVGYCDDVIWQYSRILQDLYYPFMDRLHTEMTIKRLAYSYNDIELVTNSAELNAIPPFKAMIAAQVINSNGVLYTQDSDLMNLKLFSGRIAKFSNEKKVNFNIPLNKFYNESQALTVNMAVIYNET